MITAYLLILAGFALRLASVLQNKSFSLSIKEPATLCTTGIYKYIRHPSYLGSILMLSGICLLDVHLAFIIFVVIFFLARAIQEESIQQGYEEYKSKTGMFLPNLRRLLWNS